jgi:hypothetical protein
MLSPFPNGGAKGISPRRLKISKALELVAFLQRRNLPFVRLIGCEISDQTRVEAVIFQVEVELGQKKVHDIRETEAIAAAFDPEDKIVPEILTLREDFPSLPHQNIRPFVCPRSLCLDEEPYSEQKLLWSPLIFVERIREWLRLSARGQLHHEDQPLEQLLGSVEGTIILPHDYQTRFGQDKPAIVSFDFINNSAGKFVLRSRVENANDQSEKACVATAFRTLPIEHGVIDKQPENLHALHEFCQKTKFDLLGELGTRLRKWIEDKSAGNLLSARLALVAIFPKRRHADTSVEISDVWVFLTRDNLQKIAIALGVLAKQAGHIAPTINFGDQKNILNASLAEKIEILPLRPVYTLSPTLAALYSGFSAPITERIVAVGMGALGSQIFNNMIRTGFGEWVLIDKDILLPHNCARHALPGEFVGLNKTDALAFVANATIDGKAKVTSLPVDVFDPGDHKEDLTGAFANAKIIFDFSASVPVARHLALNFTTKARLASAFLNPLGTDLVVLLEDAAKKFPLTWLEMEYYRFLVNEPSLSGHLSANGARIRYARSCGDMSSIMNQNLLALHAAIGSQTLRKSIEQKFPSIAVFRADPNSFIVSKFIFEPARFRKKTVSDWTLYISELVSAKMKSLRKERLPNETGGILIGNFDRQRQIIYVIDALPSPKDSTERPYLYIRGVRGLRPNVERIKNMTLSSLDYVGEWHSHPPRCSPELSRTDRSALAKLAVEMSLGGLPALMMIIADGNRQEFYIR